MHTRPFCIVNFERLCRVFPRDPQLRIESALFEWHDANLDVNSGRTSTLLTAEEVREATDPMARARRPLCLGRAPISSAAGPPLARPQQPLHHVPCTTWTAAAARGAFELQLLALRRAVRCH